MVYNYYFALYALKLIADIFDSTANGQQGHSLVQLVLLYSYSLLTAKCQ